MTNADKRQVQINLSAPCIDCGQGADYKIVEGKPPYSTICHRCVIRRLLNDLYEEGYHPDILKLYQELTAQDFPIAETLAALGLYPDASTTSPTGQESTPGQENAGEQDHGSNQERSRKLHD